MIDRTRSCTIVGLLSTALLLIAPLSSAASLVGQVDTAAEHADALVNDTRSDPPRAIANLTNTSWHARELNWTVGWSCDTVAVLSEDGEGLLQEHELCPEADDAQAGPPEPETRAETHGGEAVPLGNASALEDQLNATAEAVEEIREDPSTIATTLQRYVNRTVRFVHHVLGLPGDVFDAVREAVGEVANAVEEVGDTIGGEAAQLARTVGGALRDAGRTLAETGHEAWNEAADVGRETAIKVGELAREIIEMTKAPLRELGDTTRSVDPKRPPSDPERLLESLGADELLP